MKHTVKIMGRRPGGEWGTIDRITRDDPIQAQIEAERMVEGWKLAAADFRGAFVNWDFKLA